MTEVQQPPNLERPDLKQNLAWAGISRVHSEWLRFVAPQLGLDPKKLVLGGALSSIIGDDANSFGYAFYFNPELSENAKASIYERMDWESSLPEMPKSIKDQIRKVKSLFETLVWTDKDDFNKARDIYVKEIKNFTQHQIALNKNLREAVRYSDQVVEKWSPYWSEFLYGHKGNY